MKSHHTRLRMALFTAAAVAMGVVGLAGEASASNVTCPIDFTQDGTAKVSKNGVAGQLTAASACEYMDPPDANSVADQATVNANAFFTFTDWVLLTGFSQVDASASSGTFLLPAFDASKDYMVVFKDGAGTNLTGFLLNETTNDIAWSTPFTSPPFVLSGGSTSKEVSHYSVFHRTGGGGGFEVPAPATLALLGSGLVALGALRRRLS